MDRSAERKVNLRVLIDKDKNKVVFVEANGDFVDILLSFLTLPMGTIVKLANSCSDGPQLKLGSLSTLYESVKNIDQKYLSGDECQDMLLNPKNSSKLCKKLKINVDNTEPVKYFLCRDCCSYLSTWEELCSCGELMEKIGVKEYSNVGGDNEGVFVKQSAEFIITDDLSIREHSVGATVVILKDLGVNDVKKLDSLSISVGLKEILHLLKLSVLSRTPLTDLIMSNVDLPGIANRGSGFTLSKSGIKSNYECKMMKLAVMVQRSVQKVLFAQVEEDFVDFLFSILVMPLGSVVSLLGDNSSFGSIDKLYKSIQNLNVEKLVKSRDLRYKLLYPIVAPDFLTEVHIHPTIARGGFVSKPAKFMVTDDLIVTPLTSDSGISALKSLKIPISYVIERQVQIGIEQALSILKASLNSTSALTDFLNLKSESRKTTNSISFRDIF